MHCCCCKESDRPFFMRMCQFQSINCSCACPKNIAYCAIVTNVRCLSMRKLSFSFKLRALSG